ncbi:MAG: T9SS type A sorting domain-containing protein, partial [Bacteroidales bacterium]
GDPNRTVTIDSLNTDINDTWGSPDAINDPAAGPISAIYPNPCTSQINITFFENLNDINKVEIYNIIGEVVQTIEGFRSQQITINTSDLTNGVYIIAVHNKQGIQTSKFVKE